MTGPRERENVMKGTITTCLAERVETKFGADYAPQTYKAVVARWKTARETILSLDALHVLMTQTVPNARPPRFDYEWLDENTLEVTYKSHRNLLGIYKGLARGVGKYLDEPVKVFALDWDRVRIEFA